MSTRHSRKSILGLFICYSLHKNPACLDVLIKHYEKQIQITKLNS